jgi:hypothetical protein
MAADSYAEGWSMSRPIQAGDLVMVVKPTPCCGSSKGIGRIFKVAVVDSDPNARCVCGKTSLAKKAWTEQDSGYFASCLIRIDPPAQDESVGTEREVVV